MQNTEFSAFPLDQAMLHNLGELGYVAMTPVQAQSLPHILNNADVIVQAKTGSGKTAAFAIGVLNKLNLKLNKPQSLILCPTRELADQVAKEIRRIARFAPNIKVLTLCGGTSYEPQIESLDHGAHIVVGTPGRVLGLLENGALNLKATDTLVLDEAHRMLDMGFLADIKKVIAYVIRKHQTMLYSATYPDEILELSAAIQVKAVKIQSGTSEEQNPIDEYFFAAAPEKKIETIIRILAHHKPENALIFANTKVQCKDITASLQAKKINALAIHGDLEQYERNDVLVRFANRSCSVMVATDLAARGLDIKELSMVINHEVPYDTATYTHRIGRTGRAGQTGQAFTLYSEKQQFRADGYRNNERFFKNIDSLVKTSKFTLQPAYITIVIESGKKQKIRPGDILGALTGDAGIAGTHIGKIDIYEKQSYVAIERTVVGEVFSKMKKSKIKGKKYPVWILK